jgi:hypothetical protein
MSRIYISGPITGMPAGNRPAFTAARLQLQRLGHAAINPHDVGDLVEQRMHPQEPDWDDYMRANIAALMSCDAVALLDGWQLSRVSTVERGLAVDLGMPCMPLAAWIERGAA